MQTHALDYESPCPTYALAFSPSSPSPTPSKASVASSGMRSSQGYPRFAVGSYVEAFSENHITVVGPDPLAEHRDSLELDMADPWDPTPDMQRSPSAPALIPLARAQHAYPCTAIEFSPSGYFSTYQGNSRSSHEVIATTSDCLRLWDFVDESHSMAPGNPSTSRLVSRAVLANSNLQPNAPLTSFSWSTVDPKRIVTSSIDTTCTVWDIYTSTAETQLIAHDSEVYDVSWSPNSAHTFASVGADGSVRLFDIRSLDHSTILYDENCATPSPSTREHVRDQSNNWALSNGTNTASNGNSQAHGPTPLVRLAFNPSDSNYLAVCHVDNSSIILLDVRNPGKKITTLDAHQAAVNSIRWGPSGMILASCGDDCQVLVWNLSLSPLSHHLQSSLKTPKSSSNRSLQMFPSISDPHLAHTAPSEANCVRWNDTGEWVAFSAGKLVRCLQTM